jgi:hypothetical protein
MTASIKTDLKTLYETDFASWAEDQARRLREGQGIESLDVDHIAEELETMSARERRAAKTQLENLLTHLLLVASASRADPVSGWCDEIDRFREALEDLMATSASVKGDVERHIGRAYDKATKKAAKKLARYGDPVPDFPETCPFSSGELLDEDFYPQPGSGFPPEHGRHP